MPRMPHAAQCEQAAALCDAWTMPQLATRNDSNARAAKSLSAQLRAYILILRFISGFWSMRGAATAVMSRLPGEVNRHHRAPLASTDFIVHFWVFEHAYTLFFLREKSQEIENVPAENKNKRRYDSRTGSQISKKNSRHAKKT